MRGANELVLNLRCPQRPGGQRRHVSSKTQATEKNSLLGFVLHKTIFLHSLIVFLCNALFSCVCDRPRPQHPVIDDHFCSRRLNRYRSNRRDYYAGVSLLWVMHQRLRLLTLPLPTLRPDKANGRSRDLPVPRTMSLRYARSQTTPGPTGVNTLAGTCA
jgi:hypothetical protein